jgi:hypothetical protein
MSDEATPQEIAVVARQFSAMRAMIVACLAQLDAMAASLGVPMAVAGGLPGGAVGQPRTTERRDPRERPVFGKPRLVEEAAPSGPAGTPIVDLLDREVDPCPSGAPTASRAMTPLDVVPATGTGTATGDADRTGTAHAAPFGAPCA